MINDIVGSTASEPDELLSNFRDERYGAATDSARNEARAGKTQALSTRSGSRAEPGGSTPPVGNNRDVVLFVERHAIDQIAAGWVDRQ
jgi:hypothetical protein